jgi:hypothetical protein
MTKADLPALLAALEPFEHLLFEPLTQADLDRLQALSQHWQQTLGNTPDAIALLDALDDFTEACIQDGDTESAYLDLVQSVYTLEGSQSPASRH